MKKRPTVDDAQHHLVIMGGKMRNELLLQLLLFDMRKFGEDRLTPSIASATLTNYRTENRIRQLKAGKTR